MLALRAALLPALLAAVLRQAAISETGIDADVVDFQPLVVQVLLQLDERVLDDRADFCVVRMERSVDCAIDADRHAEREVAEVFRLQVDDHFGLLPALDEARLVDDLLRDVIVRLGLLRRLRGCRLRRAVDVLERL